jgi:hypothetical protein
VQGYFTAFDFKKENILMAKQLVSATLLFFNFLGKEVKPTAEKMHYMFTLRDVSTVFRSIFMANPETFLIKRNLALMWAHEAARVFIDRLISIEVISKFRINRSQANN